MVSLPKPLRVKSQPRPIQRKARVQKRKKTSRAKLVRQCDKLWSEIVRAKGPCVMLEDQGHECKGVIQAMHGLSRRYHGTRWELWNGFPGCQAAHFYWTKEPMAWAFWLVRIWGLEGWAEKWLQARRLKPDMESVLASLEQKRGEA